MSVTILVPLVLRSFTNGAAEVSVSGASVRECLDDLLRQFPLAEPRILTDSKSLRPFVSLFLDDHDVRGLQGMGTQVEDGSVIEILPAMAGGSQDNAIVDISADALADGGLLGDPDVLVMDVRTSEEWADGHIPGAVHVDRGFLEFKIKDVAPNTDRKIICYCAGGARSALAAKTLAGMGYRKLFNLTGGFEGYKTRGLEFQIPRVLNSEQRNRYSRHLAMPEVGEAGQLKLLDAKVMLVGAGGLGSPAALYLAAAGVGHLAIVDDDLVDASNLQRQIIHRISTIGTNKTTSAHETIKALNPDVEVQEIPQRLTHENAIDLAADFDIVLDGSDNFETRYALNKACVALRKPFVHGSIFRFDGQASMFWPGKGPCYQCLFPSAPGAEHAPSCAEAGVLGVLPGVIGVLGAIEVIKYLLGIGNSLVGKLISYDALNTRFRTLQLQRDPDCPCCSGLFTTANSAKS